MRDEAISRDEEWGNEADPNLPHYLVNLLTHYLVPR